MGVLNEGKILLKHFCIKWAKYGKGKWINMNKFLGRNLIWFVKKKLNLIINLWIYYIFEKKKLLIIIIL